MKIALYKGITYDTEIILQHNQYTDEDDSEFVRISEVMEVDFVILKNEEVVNKQIAILEKAKTDIQAKTQIKLNELDRRIGELLALPHKD